MTLQFVFIASLILQPGQSLSADLIEARISILYSQHLDFLARMRSQQALIQMFLFIKKGKSPKFEIFENFSSMLNSADIVVQIFPSFSTSSELSGEVLFEDSGLRVVAEAPNEASPTPIVPRKQTGKRLVVQLDWQVVSDNGTANEIDLGLKLSQRLALGVFGFGEVYFSRDRSDLNALQRFALGATGFHISRLLSGRDFSDQINIPMGRFAQMLDARIRSSTFQEFQCEGAFIKLFR